MRWYEWSLKVLGAKLAIRRGAYRRGDSPWPTSSPTLADVPPAKRSRPISPACEALVAAGRRRRGGAAADRLRGSARPARRAGQLGRVPAHPRPGATSSEHGTRPRTTTSRRAPTSSSCWASATRRRSASWRSAAWRRKAGTRPTARTLSRRSPAPSSARSARSATSTRSPRPARCSTRRRPRTATASPAGADEAIVRRLVDAAIFPDLLARETGDRALEATGAGRRGDLRHAAGRRRRASSLAAGCDAEHGARPRRGGVVQERGELGGGCSSPRRSAAITTAPRSCAVLVAERPRERATLRRCGMFTAVARQGFELCGVRERPPQADRAGRTSGRSSRCCPDSSAPAPR